MSDIKQDQQARHIKPKHHDFVKGPDGLCAFAIGLTTCGYKESEALHHEYAIPREWANAYFSGGHCRERDKLRMIERIARLEADNARLEAALREKEREVERMSKIALPAAKEIAESFNISMPRGMGYMNGILHTIRIIIETHLKGESRAALAAQQEEKP